jgi:hypothetical protein
MDDALLYIQTEADNDAFVPRQGKNPSKAKWRDSKSTRKCLSHWINSLPEIPLDERLGPNDCGFTANGIPYWRRYSDKNRVVYRMNTRGRPHVIRAQRRKNGAVDWFGYGDAWAKPTVQGKSSRQRMYEQNVWWQEAYEELDLVKAS